jgi:APA family basic amino acid/polyamine antiporter
MGPWMAVALVMGNMIGSGIFLLPASLAPYGGIALAGWLVSTLGSLALALVFARLGRINPAAGGLYAYTRQAFGDLAGFLIAWGYWISVWSSEAALAVAFVGYLDPFIPSIVRSPPAAAATAVGVVWILTALNVVGVRAAGRFQVVTTALKIIPLVAIGLAGLFAIDRSHFAIAATGGRSLVNGIAGAATLTLFAFLGLECATIPATSIENPDRTIPRATIIGTSLTAVLYIVSTVGVMALVAPAALGASTAPYADAAARLAGSRAAALVALGAAISCLGALNGWVLIVGQLPLAVARDGLFPRVFASLSRRDTPALGMVIAAVLSSALIAMNFTRGLVQLFTFIILLSTLSSVIPFAFCALAGFLLRGPSGRIPMSRGATAIATLAFIYSIGVMIGAGAEVVYAGFLLLMAGLPVYVWVRRGAGDRPPEGGHYV